MVILFGLAISYILGGRGASSGDQPSLIDPPALTGTQYILLLHEGETLAHSVVEYGVESLVNEYGAWGEHLNETGSYVSANKLSDAESVWLAGAEGSVISKDVATYPRLGGFFVVTAVDEAAAIQIAKGSPHLKYGGAIEIQVVEF